MSISSKDIGKEFLVKKKTDEAYTKRFLVDFIESPKMVSFGKNRCSEAVYYFNINDWDIKEIV